MGILAGQGGEKTKPIYSYCVLRDAYCEKEFEKTKPISKGSKWCNFNTYNRIWGFERTMTAKKQSQFKAKQSQSAGLWAEIGSPPAFAGVNSYRWKRGSEIQNRNSGLDSRLRGNDKEGRSVWVITQMARYAKNLTYKVFGRRIPVNFVLLGSFLWLRLSRA